MPISGEWLTVVRAAWLAPDLVEPPAELLERARGLWRTRRPAAADAEPAEAAASASASASASALPWQLLYRGVEVDVDLLVRPNSDGRTCRLFGQALPRAGGLPGPGSVEAVRVDVDADADADVDMGAGVAPVSTAVAAAGDFVLHRLERGRYRVVLRLGGQAVELGELEL